GRAPPCSPKRVAAAATQALAAERRAPAAAPGALPFGQAGHRLRRPRNRWLCGPATFRFMRLGAPLALRPKPARKVRSLYEPRAALSSAPVKCFGGAALHRQIAQPCAFAPNVPFGGLRGLRCFVTLRRMGLPQTQLSPGVSPALPRGSRLGERLRQLRVSAGLTQTDLAGDRFSKEYISQIERGKTRPTQETIEWLALRLGVDATFLASGVSTDGRTRAEAILTRAEALSEKGEYAAALDGFTNALAAVLASGALDLQVRILSGEAWARAHSGEVKQAIELLTQARALVEGPHFSDLDRAEILYRLGVCRYLLSSIATATALFGEALALVEASPLPSDLLRSNIFTWRSRCYRRQRDFAAAREDIERALELAESLRDTRALGEAYFQASLVAERDGQWVLARTYAERSKAAYEELTDRTNVGRLLNNLGVFDFLLGKPERAV